MQGCAERQLHRFVSQEFHRPGGFDGVWPMTLAPELAKLKGFLDATEWNSRKKMLMARQIHDSYGKMIRIQHMVPNL